MLTLTNNFHDTEARTRMTRTQMDDIMHKAVCRPHDLTDAEKRKINKIRKSLCGITGCDCGNFWGERTD